jgi:hypothetical protein
MDPVTMVVTGGPPKSKPWCNFDLHNGCPFEELGHTPAAESYKRLSECPPGSGQLVCPPLGPLFSPAPADSTRATVYIFRESYRFATISPYVFANGVRLSDLASDGYFVYYAAPGWLELSTQVEPNKPVMVDAKAAEAYYVIGYYHHNGNLAPEKRDWFQLELLEKERGAQFIKQCRLIPSDRGEALQHQSTH